MDIEELSELPVNDQWTFLRGRIAEAAVDLEAALRGLHAQLRGLDTREALLAAPLNWSNLVSQCTTMSACAPVQDRAVHRAIGGTIDEAGRAYEFRNRYAHDLLTADLADELIPDPDRIRRDGDRFLARLATKNTSTDPAITIVTLEEATNVVRSLVAATWKLRAARGYLAGRTTWKSALLGELQGEWDGTASWVYGGDDEE